MGILEFEGKVIPKTVNSNPNTAIDIKEPDLEELLEINRRQEEEIQKYAKKNQRLEDKLFCDQIKLKEVQIMNQKESHKN